jgi:hypothetical protein
MYSLDAMILRFITIKHTAQAIGESGNLGHLENLLS